MFAILNHMCILSTRNVPLNNRYELTQSSCKRDTKSKSHPGVKLTPERFFLCKHPSDAYLLLAPDYMIGDFQSGTKLIFCSHDTRMKHTRARISFRLKTGMRNELILAGVTWMGTKRHFGITWTSTEKYMEMIWTCSRMKIIPSACE